MNEIRFIKETSITKEGGMIHFFEDGNHTYLEPDKVKEIFKEYINFITKKIEEEWKTLLFFV